MDKVELDKQLIVLSEIANKYRDKETSDIEGYNTDSVNSISAPIEESVVKYNTNILEQTCNCKDWTIKRKNYSFNDPRRFCKHLIFLLTDDELDSDLSFYKDDFKYYKEHKKGYKLNFEDIFHIPNTDYKIQVNYEKDWMNLFHKNGLRYGILFNEYNEIYWAKEPSKPDDFEVVESFLTDLLIGDIDELTQNEKNMIQDKISTQITEYYQKYRNKNYIIYGVSWDDDEYGEELHWSYIVVNQNIIYLSLHGKELYIIRDKENNHNKRTKFGNSIFFQSWR
jgi:hypothetical protein